MFDFFLYWSYIMSIVVIGDVFYYVVIFMFLCMEGDYGYGEMVEVMVEVVLCQFGFLGLELVCEEVGIIVFYWVSLEVIVVWKCDFDY